MATEIQCRRRRRIRRRRPSVPNAWPWRRGLVRPKRLTPVHRRKTKSISRRSASLLKPTTPLPPSCPCVRGGGGELDFSGPRELFSSLIRPLNEEEFFSKHWEREPLLIKRGCSATSPHSSLFSLSTLRKCVKEQQITFGRHVNICRYANSRRKSYGEAGQRLTAAALDRLWRERKATIQLFQPQQFQVR